MINFSDVENREKLLNIEKNSLNATLAIQKNLNKQILVFIKNFIGSIEINYDFDPSNPFFTYMNESTSMLNKSNSNIENIQKLIKRLDKISGFLKVNEKDFIESEINVYNNEFNEYINSVYENTTLIEAFVHKISLLDLTKLLQEFKNSKTVEVSSPTNKELDAEVVSSTSSTISSDELESSYIENTLVISEIKGKVILPYKIETVKEILLNENEQYSSISDVIEKLYTIPIKEYKFASVARFREAYKLMIEKEHASKFKAISLASELFGNYNLHPAIITACNSLDQLDIYLACLEDNQLSDFKFFDIKYEIPPTVACVSQE